MNRIEVSKLVALFQSLAPHVKANPSTVEAWYLALDDVPYEAAQMAARVWLRERKYFPYPAELREIIGERALGLPSPEAAWKVIRERINLPIGDKRLFEPIALPAPAKDALDSIGGIGVVKDSSRPELTRKAFMDAYERTRRDAVLAVDMQIVMPMLAEHSGMALESGADQERHRASS